MRKSLIIFMIALGFIFASSAVNAFDYNDWIPLLPETIGGLDKQGDPDGVNMEKSGSPGQVSSKNIPTPRAMISASPL